MYCFKISGMTSSFRFNGISNSDLNAFYHNLVPRPDLHFLMSSTTPIDYQNDQHQMKGKNTNFNIEYFLKYICELKIHIIRHHEYHTGTFLNQNYPILKGNLHNSTPEGGAEPLPPLSILAW